MIEIELDGKKLEVAEGSTIMDAAEKSGIYIPRFCYHRKLSIAANCRMCLVQVEKAPKPLPACATPVMKDMKVWTHSEQAVAAQKSVMEFLLINHPLDCPICDEGGECELQDLAVGYGASGSRYQEAKRVVSEKNLGPLIATEMTRCIHCTRCVRFGQEIAGIMELGMINRSEHAEIITFVGKTVDSELSGNMIDLCPVGALTSKPFRYTTRSWELTRNPSVSPHCGLGSNFTVQVKQNRVMRVLPRENEAINECWLSDKDRFSYEGLNSEQRLARPMLRRGSGWQEVEWAEALGFVAQELARIRKQHGAASIGALATPHQTLEELFLLGKLAREFASGNVDFRLRQSDFRGDGMRAGAPWLGMKIAEVGKLDRVLVAGSTLRKDHPLLAHRLRQATKRGTQLNLVNPFDDDLLMGVAHKAIVPPSAMVDELAQVLKAAAGLRGARVPEAIGAALERVTPGDAARSIAASLASGKNAAVFLGNLAQHHPRAVELHALAHALAAVTGARLGFLGEAANSVGGHIAGCVPYGEPAGLNAGRMLAQPLKAYLLLGVEAELDTHDPQQALAAMRAAELVVAMSPFQHRAVDYAHVLLPIAPFTETAGTYISTEGTVQSFRGVVRPLGEARPAWKVLRVLGNLLGLAGFEHDSAEAIRGEILRSTDLSGRLDNRPPVSTLEAQAPRSGRAIERIAEVPIYYSDAIVRRARALQNTRDAAAPVAAMNRALAERMGVREGDPLRVQQGEGEAVVYAAVDDRLPADCIRLAAGHPVTAGLGPMFGELRAERAAERAQAAG
ncbi:MAG: NADH-quinone oxidoreductase subunit G [Betaproteobacteria bacterium]|nr:NADH-quinone oxidoreductase subunit G [Betaproteobacteria bacterium]